MLLAYYTFINSFSNYLQTKIVLQTPMKTVKDQHETKKHHLMKARERNNNLYIIMDDYLSSQNY